MTALYLQSYPNAQTSKALEVTDFDNDLKAKIEQLYVTMEEVEALCLCAPQVGMDLAVFVLASSEIIDARHTFINPKIISKEGTTAYQSNCIYFPGADLVVKRPKKITVEYMDESGNTQTMIAENALASLISYQIDCINGVLVLEHMSRLKRERFLKKYDKAMLNAHHCEDASCEHEHHH